MTDPSDARAEPPSAAGSTVDANEPLCLTLLLREADETPEGAKNLALYLRSREGPEIKGA